MPKQIVFCADGTWNGPSDTTSTSDIDGAAQADAELDDGVTNVVKLFASLRGHATPETQALRNETEMVYRDAAGLPQTSKYIHGVGDSKNAVMKVLGGVRRGRDRPDHPGYTFISRSYAAGDSIHIVGFSRGAYTARALAE
jgi:uncharacterized protein (DUF2235 family)